MTTLVTYSHLSHKHPSSGDADQARMRAAKHAFSDTFPALRVIPPPSEEEVRVQRLSGGSKPPCICPVHST